MSTLEQAYTHAKKEYDEVTKKLDRLEELSMKDVLSISESKELAWLQPRESELNNGKTFWTAEIGKATDALCAVAAQSAGNDFVTRALGT